MSLCCQACWRSMIRSAGSGDVIWKMHGKRRSGTIRQPAGNGAENGAEKGALIQVSAVSAALNSFSKELLATHIRTCVADGIRQGDDAVIDELVTTLQKLMK